MIESRIRVRCSRCERTLMPPPGAQSVRNDDTFDTLASAEHEATTCGWFFNPPDPGGDAYCDSCCETSYGVDFSVIRTAPNGGDGAP